MKRILYLQMHRISGHLKFNLIMIFIYKGLPGVNLIEFTLLLIFRQGHKAEGHFALFAGCAVRYVCPHFSRVLQSCSLETGTAGQAALSMSYSCVDLELLELFKILFFCQKLSCKPWKERDIFMCMN